MDYLIRFVQIHETFRRPEIEALAILANVNIEFLSYTQDVRLGAMQCLSHAISHLTMY